MPRFHRIIAAAVLPWLLVAQAHGAGDDGTGAVHCERWIARLVSSQGTVEVKHTASDHWRPTRLGDTFCFGGAIRVREDSRAALELDNDTVLRLDQKTTLLLPESSGAGDRDYWMQLYEGALHLISRIRQRLQIRTPFANAGLEGTEFVVRVLDDETVVSVLEGQIGLSNQFGRLSLAAGQTAAARRGQPPVLRLEVRPKDAVLWALHYPLIFDPGEAVPDSPVLEAQRLLIIGRAAEARVLLEVPLREDPADGQALALAAVVAVAQNDTDAAAGLAERAVAAAPRDTGAQLALSYVRQAQFDLHGALAAAESAVGASPADPLAWTRVAEVRAMLGDTEGALGAADRAAQLAPNLSRTQTVLGFVALARLQIDRARSAFEAAIASDPADPLPRMGQALAKIRRGFLADGRRDLEIAASLDPLSSLIRSYLGRAYFDERRDALASDQFRLAKEFDPRDPTPWLNSAILKQITNRPVDALVDLERSIALNDNRAVYRSRFLLDSDLAARSASLARIYGDLGFDRRALVEGWSSVNADPGNWSAHRLLADAYALQSRQNVARVSELFQSLMYQELNVLPLQPQAQEDSLPIVARSGPTAVAFNEFHPLFLSNGTNLQLDGSLGSHDTWGNNLVAYGLHDRLSYSFGQFHYETDGFRPNNHQREDIYNAFVQFAISPEVNVQAELRRRVTEQGDLAMRFDPDAFSPTLTRNVEQDTGRIGLRLAPWQHSSFLASLVYVNREGDIGEDNPVPGDFPSYVLANATDGYQSELQYLLRGNRFNLIAGGAWYSLDREDRRRVDWTPIFGAACPPELFDQADCSGSTRAQTDHKTGYVYLNANLPDTVRWTLGYSYDDVDERPLRTQRNNPKLGLQWDLTPSVRVRAAYFETIKRVLVVEQTLEPTQVAGFTQFFDDFNGTEARTRGLGLDWRLRKTLFFGAEAAHRDIREPDLLNDPVEYAERDSDAFKSYLYWAPDRQWSFNVSFEYEDLDSDGRIPQVPETLRTTGLPLEIRHFRPSGVFGGLRATWTDQTVRYSGAPLDKTQDQFWLFDASLGYRLPNRRGIVSVDMWNLFDKEFYYLDDNFRTAEPVAPRFIPDRTLVAKLSLSF